MPAPGISISDYTVLGIVDRDGPCVAYGVMCAMAASPSSFYRKRASSTYASIQKLIKLGLIETNGEPGPRGERPLSITAAGHGTLQAWLISVPKAEVTHSNDLVRLRLNFIRSLPREARLELVRRSKLVLEEYLGECEAELPRRVDPLSHYTLLALIYETRARIEWIAEVEFWVATTGADEV